MMKGVFENKLSSFALGASLAGVTAACDHFSLYACVKGRAVAGALVGGAYGTYKAGEMAYNSINSDNPFFDGVIPLLTALNGVDERSQKRALENLISKIEEKIKPTPQWCEKLKEISKKQPFTTYELKTFFCTKNHKCQKGLVTRTIQCSFQPPSDSPSPSQIPKSPTIKSETFPLSGPESSVDNSKRSSFSMFRNWGWKRGDQQNTGKDGGSI